ncbi:ras guanine nucleotide exchange factor domain-containing protein [Zopfochytrium polystomum]|nr:ras guanine nucleotide exchange factor domain-containing protein [Zopfochytrium polystomum]
MGPPPLSPLAGPKSQPLSPHRSHASISTDSPHVIPLLPAFFEYKRGLQFTVKPDTLTLSQVRGCETLLMTVNLMVIELKSLGPADDAGPIATHSLEQVHRFSQDDQSRSFGYTYDDYDGSQVKFQFQTSPEDQYAAALEKVCLAVDLAEKVNEGLFDEVPVDAESAEEAQAAIEASREAKARLQSRHHHHHQHGQRHASSSVNVSRGSLLPASAAAAASFGSHGLLAGSAKNLVSPGPDAPVAGIELRVGDSRAKAWLRSRPITVKVATRSLSSSGGGTAAQSPSSCRSSSLDVSVGGASSLRQQGAVHQERSARGSLWNMWSGGDALKRLHSKKSRSDSPSGSAASSLGFPGSSSQTLQESADEAGFSGKLRRGLSNGSSKTLARSPQSTFKRAATSENANTSNTDFGGDEALEPLKRNREITAGTVPELIAELFARSAEDTYVDVFLSTFQSYLTVSAFLQYLETTCRASIQIFGRAYEQPETPAVRLADTADAKRAGSRGYESSRGYEAFSTRFLGVISRWARQQPSDFEGEEVRAGTLRLLDVLDHGRRHDQTDEVRLMLQGITKQLDQKSCEEQLHSDQKRELLTEFDFLRVSTKKFARQLTLIDLELYRGIHPDEFCRFLWYPNSSAHTPVLTRLVQRFNTISFWVPTLLLSAHDPKRRVELLEKVIKLAKRLLDPPCNNYNAAYAIVGGLALAPVSRLKRTWALIGSKADAAYRLVQEALSYRHNYREYRRRIDECSGPAIPIFGVVTKDLTFANDGNPSTLPSGLINFDKFGRIHGIASKACCHQISTAGGTATAGTGSGAVPDADAASTTSAFLSTYCRHLPVLPLANLTKLSHFLEPPPASAAAASSKRRLAQLQGCSGGGSATDACALAGSLPAGGSAVATAAASSEAVQSAAAAGVKGGEAAVAAAATPRSRSRQRSERRRALPAEFLRLLEIMDATSAAEVVGPAAVSLSPAGAAAGVAATAAAVGAAMAGGLTVGDGGGGVGGSVSASSCTIAGGEGVAAAASLSASQVGAGYKALATGASGTTDGAAVAGRGRSGGVVGDVGSSVLARSCSVPARLQLRG